MADREVTVKTNIVTGPDTISTVLQQQRQEIEALRRAQRELQRESAHLPPVAQPLAALSAARMAALQQARALEQAPAGLGRDEWRAVLERTRGQQVASQQRQRSRELAGLAEARLTGLIPARDVAAVGGDEGGGGGGLGTRGMAVALRAMQSGHLSAALMARSLSSVAAAAGGVAGPVGAIVSTVAAAVSVVEMLDHAFSRTRHTVAELHAEHEGLQQSIRAGRTTGLATEQGAMLALSPTERYQVESAVQRGRPGEVGNILQGIGAAAGQERQRLEAEGGGAAGAAALELELRQSSDRARTGLGGAALSGFGFVPNWANPARAALRQQRLALIRARIPGIREQDIPQDVLDSPVLTEEQVRNTANLARRPTNRARAREELAQLARDDPVALMHMIPGAPRMPDTGFVSRQTDVLQTHEEAQREMVRDRNQERNFQTMIRELERANVWLQQLAAGGGALPGAGGSWWGAFASAAWTGAGTAS